MANSTKPIAYTTKTSRMNNPKKILVTGASGFVGSFLVEECISRGLSVYAGIRPSSSKEFLKDPKINFHLMDFSDVNTLTQGLAAEKFDYIIHNAGLTKSNNMNAYLMVNRDFLQNLVESIRASGHQPQKLTFISSLAAYGPADHQPDGMVSNESTPHPVTRYGQSKLRAEEYFNSCDDIAKIIIRPTAVYGPREKDLLTVYKMLNKRIELLIGFHKQKLTFIYVKDLVSMIVTATTSKEVNKAYFVSSGRNYSAQQFNDNVKEALGCNTLKVKVPVSVIRMLGIISEKMVGVTGNYPALNKEKVNELECLSWQCDIGGLVEDFNFAPHYSLADGMAETISWYKKNNWL